MESEIWKDISGCLGKYKVSSLGNIMRVDYRGLGINKILKQSPDADGYLQVTLYYGIRQITKKVHKLVAINFIDNVGNKAQVNHLDGVKKNNMVSNLEWCTNSENQIHAVKLGLRKPLLGEDHPMFGKVSPNFGIRGSQSPGSKPRLQFDLDGEFIKEWSCASDIERELGICGQNIYAACKGIYKTAGGFIWKYKQ